MNGYAVTLRVNDAAWTICVSHRALARVRLGAFGLLAAALFLTAPFALAAVAARDSAAVSPLNTDPFQ